MNIEAAIVRLLRDRHDRATQLVRHVEAKLAKDAANLALIGSLREAHGAEREARKAVLAVCELLADFDGVD